MLGEDSANASSAATVGLGGGDVEGLVVEVLLLGVVWPLCSIFCVLVWRSAVGVVGREMVRSEEGGAY